MTTRDTHLNQYRDFRKGADLEANPPPVRVDALFLATFHLIDACAAAKDVHLDKRKNVRRELESNHSIFGSQTKEVIAAFQELESGLRPKFVHDRSWRPEDFDTAFSKAAQIERICEATLR